MQVTGYGKENSKELEALLEAKDTPLERLLDLYQLDTNLKALPESVAG